MSSKKQKDFKFCPELTWHPVELLKNWSNKMDEGSFGDNVANFDLVVMKSFVYRTKEIRDGVIEDRGYKAVNPKGIRGRGCIKSVIPLGVHGKALIVCFEFIFIFLP